MRKPSRDRSDTPQRSEEFSGEREQLQINALHFNIQHILSSRKFIYLYYSW